MADKKFKRFEKRFIPNKMGGMDTVMVPRDLTLEEKIVEKIRERAPKKKMGGGMMKKPMGYTDGGITFKEYLEGRDKEERRRGRQKLLDDFEEFKIMGGTAQGIRILNIFRGMTGEKEIPTMTMQVDGLDKDEVLSRVADPKYATDEKFRKDVERDMIELEKLGKLS